MDRTDDIEETIFCSIYTVDILDCTMDDRVDMLDPPMVERLMKLRFILVEKVDIVERSLS